MTNSHTLIDVKFSDKKSGKGRTCVLPVFSDKELSPSAKAIDKDGRRFISDYLKDQSSFKGNKGQTLLITGAKGADYRNYLLIGMGKGDELTPYDTECVGGHAWKFLSSIAENDITLDLNEWGKAKAKIADDVMGPGFATGMQLAAYTFNDYKSKKEDKKSDKKKTLTVLLSKSKSAGNTYKEAEQGIRGTFFARDLVNMPPNVLYPDAYAKIIQKRLKPLGVKITVLDEKKMDKLKMGALLAVGQGSVNPSRLVIMEWDGRTGKKSKKDRPLGFVGKGVTFDTGGISLKPGAGMDEMKMDMGGSAAVVGLMETLARRKAKSYVVGVVGLVENMPDGKSYRPGDIITSMAGKTIEVMNTDAEGRLVLADALTYIQREFDPEFIVDLATLTGAMMVALGYEYCGSFVNNDSLWEKMEKASKTSSEKLWRMPLDEQWRKEMESSTADLQNLGSVGRYAGACTAAGFLENFIDEGRVWAHMDIAGTAFIKSPKPTAPKGGTGFGVRVLNDVIKHNYE